MLRHFFIAAFRSMAANRLLSAISIFGLAIGLAAAILAGLFVRVETSKYHDLPGYDRIYVATAKLFGFDDRPGMLVDTGLPPLLRLQLPGIEAVTQRMNAAGIWRQGAVKSREQFEYADRDLLRVLPLRILHGDGQAALDRPDGVIMGRALARKYFGRENAVGQTITVTLEEYGEEPGSLAKLVDHVLTVRAVLVAEDQLFVSAAAAFSPIAAGKLQLQGQLSLGNESGVYLRLKPGVAAAEVEAAFRALLGKALPKLLEPQLIRIDRLHFFNPGAVAQLAIISAIGLLTLFIAGANTVNLMVARASRRQREIGVRKVCGAGRRHLLLQFLGEAMLSVAIAAILALMLVEWLLPVVNVSLQTALQRQSLPGLDLDGGITLPLLLGVALTGLLVGAWPALVLSGFAPVQVLKGWMQAARGAAPLRFILVTAQFAILTVLIIAAGVIWQQQDYAVHEAIRFDIDQVLLVEGDLPGAFPGEVARLPGVRAARSTGAEFAEDLIMIAIPRHGKDVLLRPMRVDRGIFPFYGVTPIAGSLQLNPATGDDNAMQGVVINRSALARLGFASPQAALGQTVWDQKPWAQLPILAVVPDFWLHRVDAPVEPAIFAGFIEGIRNTDGRRLLHVRLEGRQIPETLAAIDRLWRATGGDGPIKRYFFDEHLEERYLDLQRQAQMFAFFAAIAIFLACLGLVGIAISTAERRTKEIGVRKAAGAGSGQIVALLLWQFSRPVLLANLVAWPAGFWLMQRWLSGFSMRMELGPGIFLAASAFSLAVAILTVMGQAIMVARQKPVVALRYE